VRHLMPKEYIAHIDGSGSGDPKILILAGYIAPAAVWVDFSKEWQARLSEAGLRVFKMNEMTSRLEIAAWFYRVIEEQKITAAISCEVRTAELVKVIREFNWPANIKRIEELENPYFFAYKAIMDMLAQHQDDLGIDEPVNFVFDDQSEKNRTRGLWDLLKLSSAPRFRKNMGDEPSFKKDEDVLPLQAADLYAWWIRKWCLEGVADWCAQLPFPWGIKRDIRRFHVLFEEKVFITEIRKGFNPEAQARWNIQAPSAALKELEEREKRQRGSEK
jgi:hypothetical protein